MRTDLRNKIKELLNGAEGTPGMFIFENDTLKECTNEQWLKTEKTPGLNDTIISHDGIDVPFDCKLIIRTPSRYGMELYLRKLDPENWMSPEEIQDRLKKVQPLEKLANLIMKLRNK